MDNAAFDRFTRELGRKPTRRGVMGLALAAVVGRSALATGLDRSTTLSGRTELWGWLIDAISRRPFSGWGWLGVWEDRALEAEVVGRFDVDFSTAHNAVIEMLLGVGIVGAVLLVAAVGVTTWPIVVVATRPGVQRAVGVVALGFVGYVVAVNQLETYVGANPLPWSPLVPPRAANRPVTPRPPARQPTRAAPAIPRAAPGPCAPPVPAARSASPTTSARLAARMGTPCRLSYPISWPTSI